MSRMTKTQRHSGLSERCQFLPILANFCLNVIKVSFSKGKNWQELAKIGKIRQKLAEPLGPNKKARIGKNWQKLATVENTQIYRSFQK